MGCFDYACCISGLPVRGGQDVRWLLFTESPYETNRFVGIDWFCFPRTWPLRAKYDEYGSISDFDAAAPAVFAVEAGIKQDLIEVGTGDNTVHDIATKKEMSFSIILDAVQEGRILVERDLDWKDRTNAAPKPGLPTLASIRQLLTDNGYTVLETGWSGSGYLVDEQDHGWLRIRDGGHPRSQENLTRLLPLLQQQYAAMITAPSRTSFEDEIQVMPLPNDKHISFGEPFPRKPLLVYQGMIHTHVWDAIIANSPYQMIREAVAKEWGNAIQTIRSSNNLARLVESNPEHFKDVKDIAQYGRKYLCHGGYLGYSNIPFTMSPGEHMLSIVERHLMQPFTDEQINIFLDDAAGLNCISRYLSNLNYWWKPSWYAGQDNSYRDYGHWHDELSAVCLLEHNRHGHWSEEEEEEHVQ